MLPAEATVAEALAAGRPWICVTDAGRPRGWVDAATLGALPGGTPLGQVPAEPIGHTFTVGTDSLRAALDAAVLSPAGQAVARGRRRPGARRGHLRPAARRHPGGGGQQPRHARQVQHAQEGPPP